MLLRLQACYPDTRARQGSMKVKEPCRGVGAKQGLTRLIVRAIHHQVIVVDPGSGYRYPPKMVISEGGGGCAGVELEAVLSADLYHEVRVFPGVGLDMEIIARGEFACP